MIIPGRQRDTDPFGQSEIKALVQIMDNRWRTFLFSEMDFALL